MEDINSFQIPPHPFWSFGPVAASRPHSHRCARSCALEWRLWLYNHEVDHWTNKLGLRGGKREHPQINDSWTKQALYILLLQICPTDSMYIHFWGTFIPTLGWLKRCQCKVNIRAQGIGQGPAHWGQFNTWSVWEYVVSWPAAFTLLDRGTICLQNDPDSARVGTTGLQPEATPRRFHRT